MGNSVPSGVSSSRDLRSHLEDSGLDEYSMVRPLLAVQPRFLKSIQCQHSDGLVVLKIYVKVETSRKNAQGSKSSLASSLRRNQLKLERLRNAVNPRTMPNVLPYQRFYESKKYASAFLIRQYLKHNLFDRLTALPTLTNMEQRFIAYQLLQSLGTFPATKKKGDEAMRPVRVVGGRTHFFLSFFPLYSSFSFRSNSFHSNVPRRHQNGKHSLDQCQLGVFDRLCRLQTHFATGQRSGGLLLFF